MATVQLTDEWSPELWREVVQALHKSTVYDEGFKKRFRTQLCEVASQQESPTLAYDVGCAEGSFTKIWLNTMASESGKLPKQVYLFEPVKALLDEALRLLNDKFPGIEFIAVNDRFESWLDQKHPSKLRPDLVVISHACYYFDHLPQFFQHLRSHLHAPGLIWLVVRNRDCGLYRARFDALAIEGIEDTASHQFSDAVYEALSSDGGALGESWRTVHFEHHFLLDVPSDEESQRRIFSFLAHLGLEDIAFQKLKVGHPDWTSFSEDHILAVPRSRSQVQIVVQKDADVEDRVALEVAASAERILRDADITPLDIQLARFHHPERLRHGPIDGGSAPDITYRPSRIAGRLLLWGQPPTPQAQEALESYFNRHHSFLLYETFFSAFRSPLISGQLAKISTPNEMRVGHRIRRLPDEVIGETWRAEWDRSTFDVAWTDWQTQIRRAWKDFGGDDGSPLACFAVPSRLGQVVGTTTEEFARIDTSAALFITALVPDTRRYEAVRSYELLRTLLRDYVGQTAAQILQRERDKAEQTADTLYRNQVLSQQHTVFNCLSPLFSPIDRLSKDATIPDLVRHELDDSWKAATILKAALDVTFDRNNDQIPGDLFGLFRWLLDNTHSSRGRVKLEGQVDLKFQSRSERRDAFTLFWNILDNATKARQKEDLTTVRMVATPPDTTVEIVNCRHLPEIYVRELQGRSPLRPGSGIEKICEIAAKRKWAVNVLTSAKPPITTIRIILATGTDA